MKFSINEEFIELISQPVTIVLSVCHLQKEGFVDGGYGKSLLIYPNLSLLEMYISTTWDQRA
jgi:hypothetical protein